MARDEGEGDAEAGINEAAMNAATNTCLTMREPRKGRLFQTDQDEYFAGRDRRQHLGLEVSDRGGQYPCLRGGRPGGHDHDRYDPLGRGHAAALSVLRSGAPADVRRSRHVTTLRELRAPRA